MSADQLFLVQAFVSRHDLVTLRRPQRPLIGLGRNHLQKAISSKTKNLTFIKAYRSKEILNHLK